jgi:Cu/Zn superoxide dismutase
MTRSWSAIVLAAAVLLPVAAQAEMVKMKAELSAQAQVPPVKGDGKGSAEITFDTVTRKLTWKVTYTGLTAKPTAAHFHGSATAQTTAGVLVDMPGSDKSPFEGSATLTEEFAKQLLAGTWYINIHTATYPGGEIRGMVLKAN